MLGYKLLAKQKISWRSEKVESKREMFSGELEFEKLNCPACRRLLPREAWLNGQRLGRCRGCGKLVRRVTERPWPWPVGERPTTESAPTAFEWGSSPTAETVQMRSPAPTLLELAPNYPALTLPCPYCEHVNTESHAPQQFCGNCGANLKKSCAACDAPMFVMDYFCNRCGSDQEQAKLQIEAGYWQRYNEGKRLAGAGDWAGACRELGLFVVGNGGENDPLETRRARQFYLSTIAPRDNNEGVELYNQAAAALEKLRQKAKRDHAKPSGRNRWGQIIVMWSLVITFVVATITGTWWLLATPFVMVLIFFFIIVIMGALGLG